MYLKNFSRQILFFVRTHATLFWWICFSTFSNFRLSFFLLSVDSSFFPLFCLCLIWSITFSFSPLNSFQDFYSDISSSSYLLVSSYWSVFLSTASSANSSTPSSPALFLNQGHQGGVVVGNPLLVGAASSPRPSPRIVIHQESTTSFRFPDLPADQSQYETSTDPPKDANRLGVDSEPSQVGGHCAALIQIARRVLGTIGPPTRHIRLRYTAQCLRSHHHE